MTPTVINTDLLALRLVHALLVESRDTAGDLHVINHLRNAFDMPSSSAAEETPFQDTLKEALFVQAQDLQARAVIELDGILCQAGDGVLPDHNGNGFASRSRYTLTDGQAAVRVQVLDGTPREEVAPLLRKILSEIEENPERLNPETYEDAFLPFNGEDDGPSLFEEPVTGG